MTTPPIAREQARDNLEVNNSCNCCPWRRKKTPREQKMNNVPQMVWPAKK